MPVEPSTTVESRTPVEPSTTRFLKTPGNSFVLPEHKLVYVSTCKVACTSLKWMVTDLGGEDLERFRGAQASDSEARVLATLDDVQLVLTRSSDGLEVVLAPGERLALRRNPKRVAT